MSNNIKKGVEYVKEITESIMGGDCYMILLYVISVVFIVIFSYSLYLRIQLTKGETQKNQMKNYYNDFEEGSVSALLPSDYNKTNNAGLSYGLIDYYVFGSYNSCCVGDVINGTVSLDALDTVIDYGVRFLDFEIYFKDNKVVVAAGRNNPYIKDTFNELDIGSVLSRVKNRAILDEGTNGNKTDPLILNFRIVTNNTTVYNILAKKIIDNFKDYLMNRVHGAERLHNDRNIFFTQFKKLKNKVLIFVDDPNQNYKDVPEFYELVNATTSEGIAKYKNYQIISENSSDFYKSLSKEKFVITVPDIMTNKNSEFTKHKNYGCQAILMNFGGGYNSDEMKSYKNKFLIGQRAFILKPNNLLRDRIMNSPAASVNNGSVFSKYWCPEPVPGEYTISHDIATAKNCTKEDDYGNADISGIIRDEGGNNDISDVIIYNYGNSFAYMPSKVRIDVRDPSGDSLHNGGPGIAGNEKRNFEGEIEVNKSGSIEKLKIDNGGSGYLGNRVTIAGGSNAKDKNGNDNPYGGQSLRYVDITVTRIQ